MLMMCAISNHYSDTILDWLNAVQTVNFHFTVEIMPTPGHPFSTYLFIEMKTGFSQKS